MTLNGSGSTPAAGTFFLRREEGHARPETELRESLECEMRGLFALRLHDWMLRRNLALNSGIGFLSFVLMDSGDQGFWEA